ncbi:sulfatase-like hydrolase/transferase [Flavobacteriaceae bacterium TP-CH-4]|uniref:Sulfatase-like hydrolase/transferase n=1 Tax=Pelagihabitans pacificus TaxID=2696054 RepID=A0A967E555_9FLAO|nr:sulfatase-like hydrolase/transferase [Pelagihabitans pacificus]NHF59087.1 sulfatase-like hydrolase/transferase [Pelagihabitans pacificus]
MLAIQLIILLLILSIIRSFIPLGNKVFSVFLSFFLALIYVVQLSSVIVTGEIADYRFYENFNLGDVLSVAGFFGKEGVLVVLALFGSIVLIHYLARFIRSNFHNRLPLVVGLVVGVIVLSLSGGILNNAYSTILLKFAGNASFNEALSSLNIDENQYVGKEKIKASKGKNIIVLSLESMEKGYLGAKLKHLTPNLSDLAKRHSFYNMKQSPAGGWTSASMYTMVTGVPAFFGTHGNSVFQNSYENKLTSLADVLKSAGYDLQYFIGKKEYSGIDDMLKTLGFTVKSEKDFDTKYDVVDWGIQDMDLFAEFKKELLLKKESTEPFALFLSSISTHFPNGVPDRRVDSLLPSQKSRLELMVSATDYFVGDLIDFMDKEGMLSNTVFYIYPDHLLMGNKSRVLEDFEERSLYVITNSEAVRSTYRLNQDIYQIDLPKLILDGAGVKHNAKFLTDFIIEPDKNAFLRQNDKNLLRLNDAALKTLDCEDGIYVTINKEKAEFEIRNSEDLMVLSNKLPDRGSCQRVLFDKNLRPFNDYQIEINRLLNDPKSFAYLDIFVTNGNLHGSLKGEHHFGITKKGTDELVFDKDDLALLGSIALVEDKQEYIILESNSWNAKKPSSFSIRGKKEQVSRGLTLLYFNTTKMGYEHRTFDTYGSREDTKAFIGILESLTKDNAQYIILAHDSAAKSLHHFSNELKALGLEKLSGLLDRQAYLGYSLEGKQIELVDGTTLKTDVPYPKDIKNNNSYFAPSKLEFVPRTDRYIAHAGGMINGIKYTNTREALDYNYAEGFRLFELDILETSDGEYVAAHDWGHWAKETKYLGNTPVSLSEFKQYKIRDKYTPLDMRTINEWFGKHSDAILITDKVNNPENFASQFVDKNRLMMELFSLSAVKEAVTVGVVPLLSESLLGKIEGDIMSYLKANNVNHIAMSRRNIANKKQLLSAFRENQIKVYVYHVNFDAGKDEQHVFDNEIGLVYGMYADQWIPSFMTTAETHSK